MTQTRRLGHTLRYRNLADCSDLLQLGALPTHEQRHCIIAQIVPTGAHASLAVVVRVCGGVRNRVLILLALTHNTT